MAAKPIAMEQLKRVLTLYKEGQSIKGIVRLTGLSRNTVRSYLSREVFVATLPYSGLIFCEAVRSQKTPDMLEATNEMATYIGGVTHNAICDKRSTMITSVLRYIPV